MNPAAKFYKRRSRVTIWMETAQDKVQRTLRVNYFRVIISQVIYYTKVGVFLFPKGEYLCFGVIFVPAHRGIVI